MGERLGGFRPQDRTRDVTKLAALLNKWDMALGGTHFDALDRENLARFLVANGVQLDGLAGAKTEILYPAASSGAAPKEDT